MRTIFTALISLAMLAVDGGGEPKQVIASKVIETRMPCNYAGVCCQWGFGFKYQCGFHLSCDGVRVGKMRIDTIVLRDGGTDIDEIVLDRGECR